LAILSAALVLQTFKMRDWTGISRSVEWPLAAAILLMIVWFLVRRKDGFRPLIMVASAAGITIGFAIGASIHRLEAGKTPSVFPVLMAAALSWQYLYFEKRGRDQAAEFARIDAEYEKISALPQEEALRALEEQIEKTQVLCEESMQRMERSSLTISILIGIAIVLTVLTLPLAFRPEPKPLMIVLSSAILVIGASWFVFYLLLKRSMSEERVKSDRSDGAG
jgi:hypothetical protein